MRGQSLDASKGEKNQHRWKYLIKQVHQIGACQNLQVGLNGHCRLKLFRTEPPVLGGFALKLMVNGRSIKTFSHLKAIFSGTFRCNKDRLCYLSRKEQPSGGLEPKILLIGSILQDAFDGGIKRPRAGNCERRQHLSANVERQRWRTPSRRTCCPMWLLHAATPYVTA